MNPTTPSNREKEVFEQALDLGSGPERQAFVKGACGEDAALCARVLALLQANETDQEFLPAESLDLPTVLLPVTDKPGDKIGRYRLMEKIGEGGCGIVYVAEQDEPVRRKVALKVIKLGMDTREVVARFEAERQALAMMDHPNIARVLDGGATDAGRPYFVLELVRGVRISDFCDQHHLPTVERLKLFVQVCHAIQHAHQKGIIHRDIKPSNILVSLHDDVPVPKVIDFGIAKAVGERLTDKTIYTRMEQFLGTPAYMSPEQAGHSDLDVDTRSDIYALGVLLYELLAGRPPFDPRQLAEAGLEEMVRCIREQEPLRPSTRLSRLQREELTTTAQRRGTEPPKLISLLRGDLDWIVMKCLEKDRTRRYDTANGLAHDIESYLNHEPIMARPPSSAYRVGKFVRRNKVMVAAGSAVAVALVLGVVGSSWQAVRATRAEREQIGLRTQAQANEQKALAAEAKEAQLRKQAQVEAYASDMKAAQIALQQENRRMAVDLLRRHLPKPGEEDLRGIEWRYLWKQSRSDEVRSFAHGVVVHSAVLTSDRRYLCTVAHDGKVRIWDPASGERVREFSSRSGFNNFEKPIDLSPDGRWLAFVGEEGVEIRDTTDWSLVRQLKPGHPPLGFSPNGKWLVALGSNSLEAWETVSWARLSLTNSWATANNLAFTPDSAGVLYASQDGHQLLCGDLQTGATTVLAEVDAPFATAVSPNGKWIAAGSISGELSVWELPSWRLVGTYPAHPGFLIALAYSPDGKWLATTGNDLLIHLWETGTTNRLATFRGHLSQINALAFSRDGQTLVSSSSDGTAKFWDLKSWSNRSQSLALPTNSVPVGLLRDGSALVTVDSLALVTELRRLPDGQVIQSNTWSQLAEPGSQYRIFPRNQRVVAVSTNGLARVWNLVTGAHLQSIQLELGTNFLPGFLSPDDRWLLETHRNPFRLYDLQTGRHVQKFWALAYWNGHAAFSPDSRWLACGTTNYDVRFWDLGANQTRALLNGHEALVDTFRFSPDGKVLASCSWDGEIRLWSVTTGKALGSPLRGNLNGVRTVDFSADGKTLASDGTDRTVRWWNVATCKEMLLFPEITFNPDYAWGWADFNPGGNVLIWLEHPYRRADRRRQFPSQSDVQITTLPTLAEIDAVEARQAKDGLPR
jgi:WD40 repeat protein